VLAYFGASLLVRIILATRRIGTPLKLRLHTDVKALLFTTAATLFTELLFGLLPAFRALRPSVARHYSKPAVAAKLLRDDFSESAPGRGASRSKVTRVLCEALSMVCVGLIIGVPLAFWGKRFAATLIPDLPAASGAPIVFGSVGNNCAGLAGRVCSRPPHSSRRSFSHIAVRVSPSEM
jgi:hypothetical protein